MPRNCFLMVLLVLGLNVGCTVSDRQVIDQAEKVHGSLDAAVIRDRELVNYFQQIGQRIIAEGREADAKGVGPKKHFDKKEQDDWMYSNKMQFHLVNSKTLNAFTTGGEHMYIYNALFQSCKSEDELVAVMNHEYAHVYCRHVAKGMQRQLPLLIGGAVAGGAAGYALGDKDHRTETAVAGAAIGTAGAQFLNMGFTRDDENEADEFGFYFHWNAGWDPNRFSDFFQRMIDLGYDKTPEMLSDHPSLSNRVKATKERVSKLPPEAKSRRRPPVADAARFKQLQERAAELGKKLPDDKSLANSQELAQALPRSCVAPVDPPDAMEARKRLSERSKKAQEQQTKK